MSKSKQKQTKVIEPTRVYLLEELAELLGTNQQTITKYVREKKLRARRIGRFYQVTGQSILDFVEKK